MADEYPIEIDVQTVKQLIDSGESFLFLDVREPDEYATAKIDGTLLIPMRELGQRIDELDPYKEGRIVVHCHHGGRSMQVTEALRARGMDTVQNMAGGIDAWSLEIDSDVPRY